MAEQPVAVVTGATSGIGRYIARGLAHAGHHVVIVARDPQRAAETQRWLGLPSSCVMADLSLLAEARRAGEAIATAHGRVAVLVNNAGLITRRREETAEGHERILATNHLAPFVLTGVLEEALRAAGRDGMPARVVNIGSRASERAHLNLDDLELRQGWSALKAYGRSKLALTMATLEHARRLRDARVVVHVVHPGVVATRIGEVGGLIALGWRLIRPFTLTPEQGADTPLYVATAPEAAASTGLYWKDRHLARPNPQALDPAAVARLWAETERLAG